MNGQTKDYKSEGSLIQLILFMVFHVISSPTSSSCICAFTTIQNMKSLVNFCRFQDVRQPIASKHELFTKLCKKINTFQSSSVYSDVSPQKT